MDDEDGSAVDEGATDEGSSGQGVGPWDSTMHPPDSDDGSERSDEESVDDEAWDDEDGEGNVAGALAPDVPVEPGRPDPVNVVFVVLGASLGVVAIASLLGTGGTLALIDYAAVTVGFLALCGLVYGLLTRTNPDT